MHYLLNKYIYKIIIFVLIFCSKLNSVTIITNYAQKEDGFWSWGIYHLNQPPVYYAEDYYLLYAQRNYYGEDEIKLNIVFMQGALKSPFRPPYKALVKLPTPKHQKKYQSLIKMRCNLRILKDYLYLGRLYDMPELRFFHPEVKEDLIKSLNFAKYYYEVAEGYWIEVKKHAVDAYLLDDVKVDLPDLEDEMALIINRDVDWQFDRIIKYHLERVNYNIKQLEELP